MTTAHPSPDGNLPAALRHLEDAISLLVDPHLDIIANHRRYVPSWWQQLCDDLAGQQGTSHTPPRSLPLIWVECHDLKAEIDTTVSAWQLAGTDTPDRLHAIEKRQWRRQDCRSIGQITDCVTSWVRAIRDLISGPAMKTLNAPCLNCQATHVYRRDSAGEQVKRPALSLSVDKLECLRCHTIWTSDKFLLVAAAYGYPTPHGMSEMTSM